MWNNQGKKCMEIGKKWSLLVCEKDIFFRSPKEQVPFMRQVPWTIHIQFKKIALFRGKTLNVKQNWKKTFDVARWTGASFLGLHLCPQLMMDPWFENFKLLLTYWLMSTNRGDTMSEAANAVSALLSYGQQNPPPHPHPSGRPPYSMASMTPPAGMSLPLDSHHSPSQYVRNPQGEYYTNNTLSMYGGGGIDSWMHVWLIISVLSKEVFSLKYYWSLWILLTRCMCQRKLVLRIIHFLLAP